MTISVVNCGINVLRALIVELTLRNVSSNMNNISAKTEFHRVLLPIFTLLDGGRLAH